MQFVRMAVYDWLSRVCGLCINQGGCCGHSSRKTSQRWRLSPNLHIQSISRQHHGIAYWMQLSDASFKFNQISCDLCALCEICEIMFIQVVWPVCEQIWVDCQAGILYICIFVHFYICIFVNLYKLWEGKPIWVDCQAGMPWILTFSQTISKLAFLLFGENMLQPPFFSH